MDGEGEVIVTVHKYLGQCTNNVAEYQALMCGLEASLNAGCRRIRIFMDSELLVRQINNEYRVKNAGLIPLMKDVRKWLARFESYEVKHIPRGQNKLADQLANQAIDEAM